MAVAAKELATSPGFLREFLRLIPRTISRHRSHVFFSLPHHPAIQALECSDMHGSIVVGNGEGSLRLLRPPLGGFDLSPAPLNYVG